MLCKLSLKNIRKSFKDYAIYFTTLILGVAIFYVFNAIDSQVVLLDVTSSTYSIIKLMTSLLEGVSVFVSFILGFLIIYASRFLIKRRNKEFGIYLTLGMGKRKISAILFVETLAIGLLSLIVGLGLGVALSQLMSLLVASMFEADMTKFAFTFSMESCLKTIIYFGIMYLIVIIFNTIVVSKARLIELLHSRSKAEKIRLKNPVLCTIIFIASCLVLARAYYMVTTGLKELSSFEMILVPVAMGSISTFFIFWSLSGLLLKIFMSMKKLYYKGLNSFTLRQFSSKINTMVFSMTVICLMLFVTICVLSSSLSIKNSLAIGLDELAPADIEFSKPVNVEWTEEEKNKYGEEVLNKRNLPIVDSLKGLGIDMDDYFKEYEEIDIYKTKTLSYRETFGNKLAELMNDYRFINYDTLEDIIKISDYNRLARFYGIEEYNLESDEYIVVADFASFLEIRNDVLSTEPQITLGGRVLHPKYTECQNGFVEISSNHITTGLILVPDDVVDSSMRTQNILAANYVADTKEEKRAIEDALLSSDFKNKSDYRIQGITTRIEIADASIGLGACVTFIGLYLGIIFLISSAAILALKELSESADNKERFRMLRKLGCDERLIDRALFRQIAIFFMTPLILAIIHSIFGIKFCTLILETIGTKEMTNSIFMTLVFLAVIYGTYFIITYLSSKNIIKERRG